MTDTIERFRSPPSTPPASIRINALSVGERVKLAYHGSREDRSILIRDANTTVAISVIKSGRLTPPEVVKFARNRNISGAVVDEIARSKIMLRDYAVKVALVNNPKTPLQVATPSLRQKMRDRVAARDAGAGAGDP